jgi:hypothetical protein
VEKEIPQESNNLYDIYQQNVHKFFDELRKSIFQYQQSISNLQLECIKSCGIILDSALLFSQKFEDNSNIITYDTPPMRLSPTQTKVEEEQGKVTKEYTIQTQTLSESPTLQSASITSSQEMLPPKPIPKKIRKFDAERFWKNAYAHQRGKLLRMIKIQDEQIKILVNEHYQDLPTSIKHEIETSGIKKEDLK